MNTVGKDGISRRVHLQKASEGIIPDPEAVAELEGELELPFELVDIWQSYVQLDVRRSYTEFGPVRFSWGDLFAFQAVTGKRLSRWQLRTIFAVENAFFEVRAEHKT